MIGTPGYMAPEQRYGEDVTPRADLYAAGLVLFKCMTGRDWTLSEPVEITLSDVPNEFRQVVSRAVAIDPGDRWSDAAAFRVRAHQGGASRRAPRERARPQPSALTVRRLAHADRPVGGHLGGGGDRTVASRRWVEVPLATRPAGPRPCHQVTGPSSSFCPARTLAQITTLEYYALRDCRSS